MPGTQLQEDEAHTKMLTLSQGCYRVHRCHGFSSVSTGPVDTGGKEGRQGKPHTDSSPAGRALAEMSRTVLCEQTTQEYRLQRKPGGCELHTSCKNGTAIAVRQRISLASPTYKVVGCVPPKFKIAILNMLLK